MGGQSPRTRGTASLADLRTRLDGRLATPGQSAYRPRTLLYNPRFDDLPRPQAIALPASAADVAACVQYSADGGAPLRIRGGGHSYGGWSSGPGLVVDMANLRTVRVDRSAGTATIGAGARLADVYAGLARHGVSIGGGSCATVGIAGLTLGGGVGLLTRRYGLTCDQLESVVAVTADARIRTVDAHHDPDLFWALRGGGGSFAAVTALTFRVRPAPHVQEIYLQWDVSDAAEVVAAWQQWAQTVPREMWSTCKILTRPSSQQTFVEVVAFWCGSGSPSPSITALTSRTPPVSPSFGASDAYRTAMLAAAGCSGSANACIAAALTPQNRQPEAAASSIVARPVPDSVLGDLADAVQAGAGLTGMIEGGVSFDALGGAVADLAPGDTAFPWRTALADVQYTATWPFSRALDHPGRYDRFVHSVRAALLPSVGTSGYVNYADPELHDYARAYWGPNLRRLRRVKRTYDPHDVFSFPQSVPL